MQSDRVVSCGINDPAGFLKFLGYLGVKWLID